MIVRDYQRSITPMSVWFELATCGQFESWEAALTPVCIRPVEPSSTSAAQGGATFLPGTC